MWVLADARWAALAPLVEECRPRGETAHRNLRRTIEAMPDQTYETMADVMKGFGQTS